MNQINLSGVTLNNCSIGDNNCTIRVNVNEKTDNQSNVSYKTEIFDERKSVSGRIVEEILIDASIANVNISVSDLPNIQVHLYGQASIINGEKEYDFRIENHVLITKLNFIGECSNNDLKLDVTVPKNKVFKVISVNGSLSNITLGKGVSTDSLQLNTIKGHLETSATFTSALLSTFCGDVSFSIDAKENISVEVSTLGGDVSATFNNISYINPSCLNSMTGSIENYHKGGSGYNADVSISTKCGNILVK